MDEDEEEINELSLGNGGEACQPERKLKGNKGDR